MTARWAQLRPSDPVTLVLALAPMNFSFSTNEKRQSVCELCVIFHPDKPANKPTNRQTNILAKMQILASNKMQILASNDC